MKVVHVASEVYPYSRAGGLSNVMDKLPDKQAFAGAEVFICSPMYLMINASYHNINETGITVTVESQDLPFEFNVYTACRNKVTHFFFYNRELYARRGIYGDGGYDYSDNDIRYGLFCKAVIKFLVMSNLRPDIIHCHDWQTGVLPIFKNLNKNLKNAKTVFTIHDINNQGVFDRYALDRLGIPWELYNIDGIEYFENVSFLKAGIVFSDYITTVSKTYAEEIKQPHAAFGMEGVINNKSDKLCGIMNGIDYEIWNPLTDKLIESRYSVQDMHNKEINKQWFCEKYNLNSSKPLISYVSEFSEYNGIELLVSLTKSIKDIDASFTVLGYGNHMHINSLKKNAEAADNLFLKTGFDEGFLHSLIAASDFVLNTAMYQPCGDIHLIAMRYGCIPITSKTGGVKDTLVDIGENGQALVVESYSEDSFLTKIKHSLDIFENKTKLEELRRRVMEENHSWLRTAAEYIELYKELSGGDYNES